MRMQKILVYEEVISSSRNNSYCQKIKIAEVKDTPPKRRKIIGPDPYRDFKMLRRRRI